MKKIILLSVCFISLIFASCASSNFAFENFDSVAVMGVSANSNLSEKVDTAFVRSDNEDIDDTSALSALVDKIFYGEDPERLTSQDRVDYAYEYMQTALEDLAGLSVVPKEKILQSSQYEKTIKGNPLDFLNTEVLVTGFEKRLYSIGAKNARLFMQEFGCDCLVSAEFTFIKLLDDESKVNTNARAKVMMDVIVYDSKGKKRVYDSFEAVSSEKIPIKKFKYDKDALIALYPDVIETVINQFVAKYM